MNEQREDRKRKAKEVETTQACNKKTSPPTPQKRAIIEYSSKRGVVAIGDERWMRPVLLYNIVYVIPSLICQKEAMDRATTKSTIARWI